MRRTGIFAALACFAIAPVAAQTVANLPVTCNALGTSCVQATPVTNPDGTTIGGGGGSYNGPTAAQLPASNGAKTGANSLSVVPNTDTAFPISAASLPLPAGASTSALQTTGNTALGTLAGTVGTSGSTAPTTGQQAAGKSADGNLRPLATDSGGRLLPGQGVAATARTTLAASTATSISATAAGRIGLTVEIETALTANLFLCTTQTTSCSATSYDAMIPSGSGAGSTYTFLFAPTTALYAFTTGTPTLVANSWIAN